MARQGSGPQKLLYFTLIIIGCLLVGNATAMVVDFVGEAPRTTHPENDIVDFTIKISSLKPQVTSIELATDLQLDSNFSLWNITEPGFLQLPEGKTTYTNQSLHFDVQKGVSTPVIIHITGKVPLITITPPGAPEGIRLTYYDSHKDRIYYRVNALDEDYKDSPLDSKSYPFKIYAPEEESYKENLSRVQDKTLREIIAQLHAKGLVTEADQLLGYSNAQPIELPLLLVGVVMVVEAALILALSPIIARIFRNKRRIKNQLEEKRS